MGHGRLSVALQTDLLESETCFMPRRAGLSVPEPTTSTIPRTHYLSSKYVPFAR